LFVFSAAAAALSGALLAPRSPILTTIGFDQLVITFVVVVLGGIGSVLGNLAAGFGLGLFTSFFGAYVSPAYTTPVAFAVVLVILAVRPQGLARA
jgi:branched-chain amino acid transport system permease protein